MAPKRQLFVAPPPGKRLRAAAPAPPPGRGSSSELPASPGKRLRAFLLVVLFLKIRPKGRSMDISSRIGHVVTELGQVRCCLNTIVHELGSIKEWLHALTQKVDNITWPSPNQHNHEQLMLEANQEGTSAEAEALASNGREGKSESVRLCFLNGIKTPIYHDDEIKSESNTSIKIGIFDGDKMIESGELSNVQIEMMALEGDFPCDAQKKWTANEFNKYIARGRDGKGDVLAGEGTTFKLINGEHDVGSIRFREGSCRARKGKFVLGARVCDCEAISVRVQEAVMNPVVVLDRRNKSNEKSYPPKLQDRVHRLEEIARDGKYYKRLEKEKIVTVEDFLKALNKDPDNLAEILKINKEHKPWDKMIKHARECSLEGRRKLKLFSCTEKNVKLFFNCVHCLVGAAFFGGRYTPSEKFNSAQQELVDELKRSVNAELDFLPEDHVMTDNSPHPIHVDIYTAGSSHMSSEQPSSVRSAAVQSQCPDNGYLSCKHAAYSSVLVLNNSLSVGDTAAVEGLIPPQTEPCCVNAKCDFSHQVGSIPSLEGFSHAQIESSFANASNDPGPSSCYIADHLSTHNQVYQGTRLAGQQQSSSAFLNNLGQRNLGGHGFPFGTTGQSNICQFVSHEDVPLSYVQHQEQTNRCDVEQYFDDMEIQSLLFCPSNGTLDSSISSYINTTLMPQQVTVTAPGSMQSQMQTSLHPSNAISEASTSAQQALPPRQWSQSQENMTWNGSI